MSLVVPSSAGSKPKVLSLGALSWADSTVLGEFTSKFDLHVRLQNHRTMYCIVYCIVS
jgi:hypothetical protein